MKNELTKIINKINSGIFTDLDESQAQVLKGLNLQKKALEAIYKEKLAIYKPNHPDMIDISNQISEINSRILSEKIKCLESNRAKLNKVDIQLKNVQSRIELLQKNIEKYSRYDAEIESIKREQDIANNLYQNKLAVLQDSLLVENLVNDKLRVVSYGVPRYIGQKFDGNIWKVYFPISLTSLLLFFTLFRVRSGLFIKSVSELKALFTIPVVAVLPTFKHNKSPKTNFLARLVHGEKSLFSECINKFLNSLQISKKDGVAKLIAIVSADNREGKTMVSLSLAVMLAKKSAKVLLIDGDFDHPDLHRYFDLNNDTGIVNVLLKDESALHSTIQTSINGLYVMTTGPIPFDCNTVIKSSAMRNFLEISRSKFDFILIDTTKINDTSSLGLEGLVDETFFIVNSKKSLKFGVIESIRKFIAHRVPMSGFILNGLSDDDCLNYYDKKGFDVKSFLPKHQLLSFKNDQN